MTLPPINGFDILAGLAITFTLMYVLIFRLPALAHWIGVIA